jgi:hypothetical protein
MESKYIVIGIVIVAFIIFIIVYNQVSKAPALQYTQPGAVCKADTDCTAPSVCGSGGNCIPPDIETAFQQAQVSAHNVVLAVATLQSNIPQWYTDCVNEDSSIQNSYFANNSSIFKTISNNFVTALSTYITKSYYLTNMPSATTGSSPNILLANINLQFDVTDPTDASYFYTQFYNMVRGAYLSYGDNRLANYNSSISDWYGQECTNISNAWTNFTNFVTAAQNDVNTLNSNWAIKKV